MDKATFQITLAVLLASLNGFGCFGGGKSSEISNSISTPSKQTEAKRRELDQDLVEDSPSLNEAKNLIVAEIKCHSLLSSLLQSRFLEELEGAALITDQRRAEMEDSFRGVLADLEKRI